MQLRDIPIRLRIGRPRQPEAGVKMAPEFIGLRPGHDAERDVPRPEQIDPGLARNHLAARRQNGRHIDQVLLLDIRVAQGELERGQGVAMDAHAFGQEHAGRAGEHEAFLQMRGDSGCPG